MKKLIAIVLAVVLVATVGGVALAGGMRSSKATAAVSELHLIGPEQGYTPILNQPMKMAQGKDLFVDVSLLCGLFTQTEVTAVSQAGWDEGEAMAKIMVRVSAVDMDEPTNQYWAYPSAGGFEGAEGAIAPDEGIIFAMRQQNMWAMLNTDNTTDNMTIGLALDTMDAHSFNFVIPNLDSGEYMVVVEAMTETEPTVASKGKNKGGGDAAWAGLGFGSVTIEQVRMAKDTDIVEIYVPD